jgi:type 1 glutamine amidotransferase
MPRLRCSALAQESGVLEIVNTEDVSLLTPENLRNYDAVYFFTSGELPLSDQQKADLLDFVRSGKGFGGSHSAADCLYTWPEYGEMSAASSTATRGRNRPRSMWRMRRAR